MGFLPPQPCFQNVGLHSPVDSEAVSQDCSPQPLLHQVKTSGMADGRQAYHSSHKAVESEGRGY